MKVKVGTKSVVSVLVVSMLALSGCATSDLSNIAASGNAMSTTNRPLEPTPANKVKLFYASQENPRHYRVVGRVAAENYNLVGMEHTQAAIADELKKQAASIGANGVINIHSGLTQTTGDAIVIK